MAINVNVQHILKGFSPILYCWSYATTSGEYNPVKSHEEFLSLNSLCFHLNVLTFPSPLPPPSVWMLYYIDIDFDIVMLILILILLC